VIVTAMYSLGLQTFTDSTQPSTILGMVKWVSAFGLSISNKWQWWVKTIAAIQMEPELVGLVWGSVAAWCRSTFIKWSRWTVAMAMPWWQHHKHCPSYDGNSYSITAGGVMWSFVLSFCLFVSRITHHRADGCRRNPVGMGKEWPSKSG